ncbi:MAG: hypothetical protein LBH65_00585 [Desulfovibrio sp.]|jgi:hypothetical protein|nr:hypothetical protein [Desulfovibrio sp.]
MFCPSPGAFLFLARAALLLFTLAAAPVFAFASDDTRMNAPAEEDIFAATPSSSANALLTILYSACTFGELHPCPT